MKIKQYPLATLEYDEGRNILFFRVKQDQEVDLPQMTDMIKYVEEFLGQKKHYAVIDFGGSLTSTTEARKKYADSEYIKTYRLADAFIVKSLGVRLVANFFINVTKPKVRTMLFTNDHEALKWLESLKKQDKVAI